MLKNSARAFTEKCLNSQLSARKGAHPKTNQFPFTAEWAYRLERGLCSLHNKHAMRASINQQPNLALQPWNKLQIRPHNDFIGEFFGFNSEKSKLVVPAFCFFYPSARIANKFLCAADTATRIFSFQSIIALFASTYFCSFGLCSSACETQSGSFSQRQSGSSTRLARSQLENVTWINCSRRKADSTVPWCRKLITGACCSCECALSSQSLSVEINETSVTQWVC